MAKPNTFQGKPLTFHESLHWCGCQGCAQEIADRVRSEPLLKPDFVAHLMAEYPKTAHLLATPDALKGDAKP